MSAARRKRSRMGRWLRRGAMLIFASALLWSLYQWLSWPDVAALATTNPKTTAFIERYRDASTKSKPQEPRWRWVPYARISADLKHAVVVAEDIDFFSHDGFAWKEIEKAVQEARDEGKPMRGASTITQQLAKNLWLSPSRNPWRKVKEAMLTRSLEKHLEKRRILELYLNVVELGPGIYGAEAAARHYFGKSAAGLSSREAAQLAASLPRPASWHPGVKHRGYQRYATIIEGRMARSSWVRGEL